MLVVPEQMAALMQWYEGEAQSLHPVERAARLHSDFVKIHPLWMAMAAQPVCC